MDLAVLFARGVAALEAPLEAEFPGVSRFPEPHWESQMLEDKYISPISRISRSGNADQGLTAKKMDQVPSWAHASLVGVARSGTPSRNRENRENRENPSELDTSLSRLSYSNREIPGNGAGPAPLQGVSQPLKVAFSLLETQPAFVDDPTVQLAFDEPAAFLKYVCGKSRQGAEAQAAAEILPASDIAPAPVPPAGSDLALWCTGLATLDPGAAPCPDYRGLAWSRVLSRAVAFLDTFGAQAEALGWQTHELFGVHPEVGTVRPEHCGALVLTSGGAVRAITAETIAFDRGTYRRALEQPQGVPVWSFGDLSSEGFCSGRRELAGLNPVESVGFRGRSESRRQSWRMS